METKNNSLKAVKNSSQIEKSIFVNSNKVATDIENVKQVKFSIDFAVEMLTTVSIDPKHAANVLQNRYADIQNEYINAENQKLEAAATLLGGASTLLDIARAKIEADAESIVNNLKAQIKPLAWEKYMYLEFFEFADGAWTTKQGFEKDIETLNSIILTDPLEVERYEKHCKLVELLNELKGEGTNLHTLINEMVKFNHQTGAFSLNYKLFDRKNILPAYF